MAPVRGGAPLSDAESAPTSDKASLSPSSMLGVALALEARGSRFILMMPPDPSRATPELRLHRPSTPWPSTPPSVPNLSVKAFCSARRCSARARPAALAASGSKSMSPARAGGATMALATAGAMIYAVRGRWTCRAVAQAARERNTARGIALALGRGMHRSRMYCQ